MAQHDYTIANQGFPAFRSDLNDALAAIVSNNSGATEPTTMFAHMIWVDTAANPSILKIRNADNDAWITIGTINQTGDTFTLTAPVATTTITTSSTINSLTVGQGAGSVSTNTAVGASALAANTTGAANTAVGRLAMTAMTTGGSNVAFGESALKSATTPNGNSALGSGSMLTNTTGANNTAVGQISLFYNTTGSNNVAVGVSALQSNTTASNNTAIGYQSLYANTTGANNTAVGAGALPNATTATTNTCVGAAAMNNTTTGTTNTALGYTAGYTITTGSRNVCLGYESGTTISPFHITTQNDRMVLGYNGITNAYIQVALTVVSDARDKTNIQDVPHGLSFVQQLKPVCFQFKKSREDDTPHGNKRYGFLAQDILELEGDNPVIIDNETPDKLKYQGEALVPVLVNAIKELSAQVSALQAEVNTLKGN